MLLGKPSYLGAAALEVNREVVTHAWKGRARNLWLLGTSRDKDPAVATQSSYKGFCRWREGEGEPRDRGRGRSGGGGHA